MNKKYMEPEMEISAFEVEDVITVSGEDADNQQYSVWELPRC